MRTLLDDRAGMDARPLLRRMLALPELGQSGVIQVWLIGNDAGTARERNLCHFGRDDDAGCPGSFKQCPKPGMTEETELTRSRTLKWRNILDDLRGLSMQFAAQPFRDVV